MIVFREVTCERLCKSLGCDQSHEEMSMAAFHLIQSIVDALQGEDKLNHKGEETALRAGKRFVSFFCFQQHGHCYDFIKQNYAILLKTER